MAELKTKENDQSAETFRAASRTRRSSRSPHRFIAIMQGGDGCRVGREHRRLWPLSLYASGREATGS